MRRIVYTLAVGKPKFAEYALGLGRSLKLIGDTTRRVVVTDQLDHPWSRSFDEVLTPTDPIEWVFLSKLTALERTDADQILFIDSDSLVFKRLDPIFDYCAGRDFCVQGQAIREGEWYGDVPSHLQRHGLGELPQFNSGLIYYERTPNTLKLIERTREIARDYANTGFDSFRGKVPDEPCISLAMATTGLGHLIPDTTDFQNSGVGLVGKLRMDVRRAQCGYLCRRYDLRYVEPYVFHAWFAMNFSIYWRQLDHLARLERYEQAHPFGYLTPTLKLRRSIEKRLLKLRGRL